MSVRKHFPKTDLSVVDIQQTSGPDGRRELDVSSYPPVVTTIRVTLGCGQRTFDFAPWYGLMIDEVVFACQRQLERFLEGQDGLRSGQTILNYAEHLKAFFKYTHFLAESTNTALGLKDIDREHLEGFLAALESSGLSNLSQRSTWNSIVAVFATLGRRGWLTIIHEGENATFPRNRFPGLWNQSSGERPLKRAERDAFTAALKTALTPLFNKDCVLTGALVAYSLLVVALYTGRNTTPLLEMPVDCLRKHPREDLTFLILYKRRAHLWQKAPLKGSLEEQEHQDGVDVPTANRSVVRVIQRVLELNSGLRSEAPLHLKDRVWLYRSRRASHANHNDQVRPLTSSALKRHVTQLIRHNDLRDEQGEYLRLNVSRLRKTFINRVNEILGGDLALTAIAAGNTPKVAGIHYLRPGEYAERNWSFLGKALVTELLSDNIGATERTPTGRCSDTAHGQFAPRRDGSICLNFLNCLRCRNYVVTGDDLHRLFSFYWRLLEERSRVGKRRWTQHLAHIPRLIERDVVSAGLEQGVFTIEQVNAARARARVDRHPFWSSGSVLNTLEELA